MAALPATARRAASALRPSSASGPGGSSGQGRPRRRSRPLAQRRDDTQKALDDIAETPDEQAAKRRELIRQIEQAEAERAKAGDALASAETIAAEADKAAQDAITALSQAREARARDEERLTAATERRTDTEARITETLNCAPHEAFEQTGLAADDPLPEMEPLERAVSTALKAERERLGAVNLRAEDEQVELSERHTALTAERDDCSGRDRRTALCDLGAEQGGP